jgi:tetratricopeptide (TPR) repeat protein
MSLIIGNISLSPTISRDQEFRNFVKSQQSYYDLDHREVNDFFQRLSEGKKELGHSLQEGNVYLDILAKGKKNLSDLLGDHAQILRQAQKSLQKTVLPRNWYHDALLEIDALTLSNVVNLGSLGDKLPDSLKEVNFQAERGLVYLKGAIGKPDFSVNAIEHLHAATEMLRQKGVHDPRLYYCLGLCSFYFTFHYEKAVSFFKDAIHHLELERNSALIAKCYYELGKLYHLLGMEEESIQSFQDAILHDQDLMEAKFQLLRMLVLTKGNSSEINTLLDELEEFNSCYILKIISEKALRESHVTIAWLIETIQRHATRLSGRIKSLKEKYNRTFNKGFYATELHQLEEAGRSGQYYTTILALSDTDALEQQLGYDQQFSVQLIAELQATYDHYKGLTWQDSTHLKQLDTYIMSLQEKVEAGVLLSDEYYDDTALKNEADEKSQTLQHLQKEYGVALTGEQRSTLNKELEQSILVKKIDKIKAYGPGSDSDKSSVLMGIMGIISMIAAIYFICVEWGWFTYDDFKSHGVSAEWLNYILFFVLKSLLVIVEFAVATLVVLGIQVGVWALLVVVYTYFYKKYATKPSK